MKDRAVLLPNRRKITFDGESPKYATVENADQPTEAGTLLNKANLLSDSVVSELGLTQTDPVPSDALIHLQRSAIQYSIMPTASSDYLNKIVFFIGTTGTYVNGGLYQCVSSGGGTPTYSWSRVYIGAAKADLVFKNQNVSTSSWSTYSASAGEETLIYNDGYTYKKSITLPGVLASSMTLHAIASENKKKCGTTINDKVVLYDGGIYLYSRSVPTLAFDFLELRFIVD